MARIEEFLRAVQCSHANQKPSGRFTVQWVRCRNKTTDPSGRCHLHREKKAV
jgi:hypothetical protein